jgi:hypothetical protein
MRDELRATLHELEIEHGHSSDHEAVWPVCARRHAVMDRARAALLADTPSVEPRLDVAVLARALHEIAGEFCSPFSTPEAEPGWPGGHPVAMHNSQAAAIASLVAESRPSVEPAGLRADLEYGFDKLAVWAVRYALGRMTYAVADVTEVVSRNAAALSPDTRAQIVRDIDELGPERGPNALGMGMDATRW